MPEPTAAAVARHLLSVLREAVEGPAGEFSYFIDNQPDAGLLRALSRLSAAEASRPVAGTTIAAHESRALSSDNAFGEAVGAIAHVAYHLGAIRQKMVALGGQ